jgi:hypothetical protein
MTEQKVTPSEIVAITKPALEHLLRRSRILKAPENAGVDNWEWYGDAMATLEEEEEDD